RVHLAQHPLFPFSSVSHSLLPARLPSMPASSTSTRPMPSPTATEDAVMILDGRRRIQQLTPRAAALLTRAPASLIGASFDELGSLEAMGLSVREQPVFGKGRRPSRYVMTLRLIDYACGAHDHLVAPWQGSTELALVRSPEGRVLAVNEA